MQAVGERSEPAAENYNTCYACCFGRGKGAEAECNIGYCMLPGLRRGADCILEQPSKETAFRYLVDGCETRGQLLKAQSPSTLSQESTIIS